MSATPKDQSASLAKVPRTGWAWMWFFSTRPLTLGAAALLFVVIIAQEWRAWANSGLNDHIIVTSEFIGAVALAYPIAAGVGAWLGYRESHLHLGSLYGTTTRRMHVGRLAAIGGATAIIAGAVLASGGVIAVVMLTRPHPVGLLGLDAIVSSTLMTAVWVPLGYLVARRIGHILTVPAMAFLGWLVPVMFGTGQGTPASMLLPAAAPGGDVFPEWNGSMLWWQASWFGGLLMLLIAAVVTRPGARAPRALALAGLFASVLGLIGIVALDFDRHRTTVLNGAIIDQDWCDGQSPQLCLHPAFADIRGELEGKFSDLMDKVHGTPMHTDTLEHRPRGIGQEPSQGSEAFHLDYAKSGDGTLAVQEYIEGQLDFEACYLDFDPSSEPWVTIVNQWLMGSLGDTSLDGAFTTVVSEIERRGVRESFAALTSDARNSWFRDHYDKFQHCALTAEDFPAPGA